ncbi:DUF1659 domain-containing protein [Lactobacillus hominis]|uniref:DUF1659 domain-containing protein n=1 Tax=Lactobacillus hominis DSM 23910 = CRBIP 24.179 TaxID=1423758 RepID=I7KGM9_9LACO|nr:DUF1659 domain-containing protein [Lactobacillus hominis]KRM84650.1 hypothetical protein FC41_GL000549 [Lactobacillus hominis DSM 23910 = CRBIP 24.179]MCT3347751.1 hypothetical protein [Lactobacillus hominis]CCI81375.1 Putative uncharacterized protein [Lactobacillus hominis DSM 23910 = CRBIP 24.179]
MKTNLVEQSVKFGFSGAKYKDNLKERTFKNLKLDADAQKVAQVGRALSTLQKDDGLQSAMLIQHHELELDANE